MESPWVMEWFIRNHTLAITQGHKEVYWKTHISYHTLILYRILLISSCTNRAHTTPKSFNCNRLVLRGLFTILPWLVIPNDSFS